MVNTEIIKVHFTTILLVIIMFGIGIYLGYILNQSKISSLESKTQELTDELDDLQLSFLLMDTLGFDVSCDYLYNTVISNEETVREMTEQIIELESEINLDSQEYKTLKKQFMISRLTLWINAERFKKICDDNLITILYFYNVGSCPDCEVQQAVLSYIASKTEGNVTMAAIDIDEDLIVVNSIKDMFNITETPSLLINTETLYSGLVETGELEDILCNINDELEFCFY